MRAIRTDSFLTGILLLLTMAGCDPGQDDTEVYDRMTAVLDSMTDAWNTAPPTTRAQALQLLADYFRTADCVESIELDLESVPPTLLVNFSNGASFTPIFATTRMTSDPFAEIESSLQVRRDALENIGAPGRPALFLAMHGLENHAARYSDMASRAGYLPEYGSGKSSAGGFGGVDFFRTLDKYSLIYICSHGGWLSRSPENLFGLMTSELRSTKQDQAFALSGEFARREVLLARLVPEPALVESSIPEAWRSFTHYAISNRFGHASAWHFDPYSFIFLSTCHSANQDRPMMAELIADDAGVVLGWDDSASERVVPAEDYLFERMFGEATDVDPPLRPFSFSDTFDGLIARGLAVDPDQPNATLSYWPAEQGTAGERDVVLRPNIVRLGPDATDGTIEIMGEFGSTPGEVTIGGTTVGIEHWEAQTITAQCPPERSGPVVVSLDPHRRSNPVPLTDWRPEATIKGIADPGMGPEVDLVVKLHFRADIHRSREDSEAAPAAPDSVVGLDSDGSIECELKGTFNDGTFSREYTGGKKNISVEDGGVIGSAVTISPASNTAKVEGAAMCRTHLKVIHLSSGTVLQDEDVDSPVFFRADMSMQPDGRFDGTNGPQPLDSGDLTIDIPAVDPQSGTAPDENTPA